MGGMHGAGGVPVFVRPEDGGPPIMVSVPAGSFGGGFGMPMQPPPPGRLCNHSTASCSGELYYASAPCDGLDAQHATVML
jgi:hypothetical protein